MNYHYHTNHTIYISTPAKPKQFQPGHSIIEREAPWRTMCESEKAWNNTKLPVTKTNKDKKQEYVQQTKKPNYCWMLCCSTFQTWIQSRKMGKHEQSKTQLHNLNIPTVPNWHTSNARSKNKKTKKQQVVACLETKHIFEHQIQP